MNRKYYIISSFEHKLNSIKKYESDNDLSGSFTLCYNYKYSYWIKKVNN